MTRTRKTLLSVAALTVVLSGCGTDRSQTPASPSATDFVLREWSITPPTTRLEAGKVRITAVNSGSETHELVVVRARSAASLPTNPDGSVDENKISETDKPGELPDLAAGKTATKTLDLAAGNYFAICNLVDQMGNGNHGMGNGGMGNGGMGHIHYRLGMVAQFTVT
jgi:hypothetical protein